MCGGQGPSEEAAPLPPCFHCDLHAARLVPQWGSRAKIEGWKKKSTHKRKLKHEKILFPVAGGWTVYFQVLGILFKGLK